MYYSGTVDLPGGLGDEIASRPSIALLEETGRATLRFTVTGNRSDPNSCWEGIQRNQAQVQVVRLKYLKSLDNSKSED
jgi:hypothetical protein